MKKNIFAELVVIGGGLAGVSSALSAKRSGRSVVVVGRDSGATGLSSGALDLCSDPLYIKGKPELSSLDISSNIRELVSRNIYHPYHLFLDDGDLSELLRTVEKAVELVFPKEDNFIEGDSKKNKLAFNSMGGFKHTAFTQKRILEFDEALLSEPAVIRVKGLRDFPADFFVLNLSHFCKRLGALSKPKIEEIELGLAREFSSLELAVFLESESFAEKFSGEILRTLKGKKFSGLILPSVLPAITREKTISTIEKETELKVVEPLSLMNSVAGQRLNFYLIDRLKKEGVEFLKASVKGYEIDRNKIKGLTVERFGSEIKVLADEFVLATGLFFSGGIMKRGEFRESIFNLPVFVDGRRVSKIFTEKLTGLRIWDTHPVFSAGLNVDKEFHPLDENKEIVYSNLKACGSILRGHNYIKDGTGAGVALATGYKAGQIIK